MESSNKSALYIIIAIIVVAAVGFMLYSGNASVTPGKSSSPSAGGSAATIDQRKVAQEKSALLARVSSGKPLSAQEKQEIFQKLSGSNIQKYNFTEAEKQQIIKALNAR